MKINLLLIILLLTGCQGLKTTLSNPATSVTAGIIGKKALDEVIKTLPKYVKKLKLPSTEICYLKTEHTVECKLISCEEDCYKIMDKEEFFETNVSNLIFINQNSFKRVLSEIETFCLFNEKKSICEVVKESYSSINKVFINKEKE